MLYKQLCYNTLIFLTLFTFGFFGSLSHVFNLGLIFFLLIDVIRSNQKNNFDTRAILVFCFLSACFFFLFLISLLGNKIKEELDKLSLEELKSRFKKEEIKCKDYDNVINDRNEITYLIITF